MKKCKYRNCKNIVEGRKDKIFCKRSCKTMERTYIKRENLKLKKEENGKEIN